MAEFAGIERATIGGVLAQKRPITTAELSFLKGLRATVDFNYKTVTKLHTLPRLKQESKEKLSLLQEKFIKNFEVVRQSIYQASEQKKPTLIPRQRIRRIHCSHQYHF